MPLGTSFPSPNPGGNNRTLVRHVLADWINAQSIAGVDHVYTSKPRTWQFDLYAQTGTNFSTLLAISLTDDAEDRAAKTGPVDRGGKMIHYTTVVEIMHKAFFPDDYQESSDSEDDYDRIVDALKDTIRGPGRDLSRPEVILQVGEFPARGGIRHRPNPPLYDAGGAELRQGLLTFTTSQYLAGS